MLSSLVVCLTYCSTLNQTPLSSISGCESVGLLEEEEEEEELLLFSRI